MKERLFDIRKSAQAELKAARTQREIEEIKVKYLGKKGILTDILKQMGTLSAEERPEIGQVANEVRVFISEGIEIQVQKLFDVELESRLVREKLDVTAPGKRCELGHRHPLLIVLDEVEEIFISMGFLVAEGPEVEYDHYNFEALNMPKDHPARDTQDTFYINENIVLRTQTSSVQVRVMESSEPPIRLISPGRVFRSDAVDATHSPLFHQIEGLAVDKGISFSDLKGTLETFLKRLFGEGLAVRFRPHHFPYTEPSAEVDIQCFSCHGEGCRLCKNEGFIEILGCGMVHRDVLKNCNIDPDIYSGFAFGVGLERIAMMRYEIDDMRLFFENDMRFLGQFR